MDNGLGVMVGIMIKRVLKAENEVLSTIDTKMQSDMIDLWLTFLWWMLILQRVMDLFDLWLKPDSMDSFITFNDVTSDKHDWENLDNSVNI